MANIGPPAGDRGYQAITGKVARNYKYADNAKTFLDVDLKFILKFT